MKKIKGLKGDFSSLKGIYRDLWVKDELKGIIKFHT